ncbi:MAG: 4-alpha-glucanotransferase [bacterium]|nr:4-alpha-glucanotransferase [bacterium]
MSSAACPQRLPRCSGVLLHPTSLEGPDGIGDLGAGGRRFVDWLAAHGQGLWQVLPLGPTSFGDSPYQTLSAFALNPLLISCEMLAQRGWLEAADFADRPDLPAGHVDFGAAIPWKFRLLDRAWERFRDQDRLDAFRAWCTREAGWLEDFVLFMTIKEEQEGRPWVQWPEPLALRDAGALVSVRERLADRLDAHRYRQWVADVQWTDLKLQAQALGVRVMGDLPIFVAHDSADVWANREIFRLDAKGGLACQAGVPPDYFSATGQLWGNPLYDWDHLAATGYRWWIERVRRCLQQVDLLRLDHFRGFAACWEVPAGADTAVDGRWIPGPGRALFDALRDALGGKLPLVAENLGVITPDVEALREAVGLPGMKVLQFAWTAPNNEFLPHDHDRHLVLYTGTHDNDTTLGWWNDRASDGERGFMSEYLDREITEPHWELIRVAMTSPADTCIVPMQDVLGLGREGRMNLPGEGRGNWAWRLFEGALLDPAGERLARLTWLYRRRADQVDRPDEKTLPDDYPEATV